MLFKITSNLDKTGAAHFNKKTGQDVPTPHRQGNDADPDYGARM